jgi:ubiquinone/menaquinone biosynthesis C-methylase UbiE
MTQAERSRAYYDDFATTYDRGRDAGYHRVIDDLEAGIVLPYAAGARVLEVGCGTGLILQRVAPVAGDARGIDLSPGMLAAARARGLNVQEGSATSLPFDAGSFDLVYSFKVLAHVPDVGLALEEVSRVLAPRGVAVLEFYNPWSLRYLARRIAGSRRIGRSHDEGDIPTRWDSPPEVRRLIPAGLVLERFVGVRVATPAAGLHRIPGLGWALGRLEGRLAETQLAQFGGFLVAIARKG